MSVAATVKLSADLYLIMQVKKNFRKIWNLNQVTTLFILLFNLSNKFIISFCVKISSSIDLFLQIAEWIYR
jgi:hypothetical protein